VPPSGPCARPRMPFPRYRPCLAARAADRSREVSLRLALGSSRTRILRQLLTEAGVVSLAGCMLGLAGALFALRWLSTWQPIPNIPINVPVNPDARTYLVALLLAVISALLFGMVPVRQVLRSDPYLVMKAGASGASGSRRLALRDLLLAGQIAVCAMLVTASMVAVRGLARSLHCNFGFEPQNALQVSTDLDMAGYSGNRVAVMQKRMLDAVSAIPGVSTAAYASGVPLNLGWTDDVVFTDSTTDFKLSNGVADAMRYQVSPGYFRSAATTLLAGRAFTWHDDKGAPAVAVVNQEFARKVFGSPSKAVGGYFKTPGGTRIQVVGLVEDGRYRTLAEDPQRQPTPGLIPLVGRRLQRRGHARDPRQGPAPAQPMRERPRPDHRRLPAADENRQPLRQPRDGRRRAEQGSEDPRPRAGRAGDRALPAEPCRRDALSEGSPAV